MANRRSWYGYWRRGKTPAGLIPLGARSVGGACCRSGWLHPTGDISWYNFYWMIAGGMCLQADDRRLELTANEVLVLPPGHFLTGIPNDGSGEYRWMTLDGESAEKILAGFGLTPFFRLSTGKCPVELFDQLEMAVREIMPGSEYRAGALAFEILSLAAAGAAGCRERGNATVDLEKTLSFIEQHYTAAALNINLIAEEFGIHRSRFSRLFSAAFGIVPSEYLSNLRFRRALQMLRETALPIAAIAHSCGFDDPGYFTRMFHRRMGMPPAKFRKTM